MIVSNSPGFKNLPKEWKLQILKMENRMIVLEEDLRKERERVFALAEEVADLEAHNKLSLDDRVRTLEDRVRDLEEGKWE